MTSRKKRRPTIYLLTMKQREGESLKMYLYHFNKEHLATDDQDKKIILVALLGDIWPLSPFMAEIARRTPGTLRDFMDRTDNFVNAKDTLRAFTMPRHANQDRTFGAPKQTTRANAPKKKTQERKGQGTREVTKEAPRGEHRRT